MQKSARKYIFISISSVVFLALLFIVFTSYGSIQRRMIAGKFLKALKKQELTQETMLLNIEHTTKKYKLDSLAIFDVGKGGQLLQGDIYFPIALIDYEFLSEEPVPKGLVTLSLETYKKYTEMSDETAKMLFDSQKESLKRSKAKDLTIDEENNILSYFDESPESYKLNYLLNVTNALGMTLKKNGYVRIEKSITDKEYEIVEFKY
ncbi:MAG: hypothetical protein ABFR82_15530 [Nitrospirota bacterium]